MSDDEYDFLVFSFIRIVWFSDCFTCNVAYTLSHSLSLSLSDIILRDGIIFAIIIEMVFELVKQQKQKFIKELEMEDKQAIIQMKFSQRKTIFRLLGIIQVFSFFFLWRKIKIIIKEQKILFLKIEKYFLCSFSLSLSLSFACSLYTQIALLRFN